MEFKEVQEVFDKYRLYKDRGLVRMLASATIANQITGSETKPVWVMFVAPPGGGKTDVTTTISTIESYNKQLNRKAPLCQAVSDLSRASMISGMKSMEGETSLIKLINPNGGILVFKDFTSIISKRHEDLKEVMGILRELYDGSYERQFGNGKKVRWEGKMGIIASCTTLVYHELPKLSAMGDRMLMYQIEQPGRMEVLDKIWDNEDAGVDGLEEMTAHMKEYIEGVMEFISNKDNLDKTAISKELRRDFGLIADFVCYARSGVVWDYKQETIMFVPDVEMPTRMIRQFIAIARALIAMNIAEGGEPKLTETDVKIIYKLAFDSIPNMRRNVIRVLGTFTLGATENGISQKMGMQEKAVKVWLEELIATKVAERKFDHGINKYKYTLNPKYRDIVTTYEELTEKEEMLMSGEDNAEEDYSSYDENPYGF